MSHRDTLSCSEGEATIWASIRLQLNPVTLDASQRIRLVSTMADYLHLPPGFVCLFSRRKSFIQQEKKLRVCRQGGLAEKITRGNEKQDASADVAQLLWRAGCQGEERQSDLVKILEYSVTAGGLAKLLGAPILGWRVLCSSGVIQHKVKRDLHRLKFTPTADMIVPPPTQIHQTLHSHIRSVRLAELEPSLSSTLLLMNHSGTRLEPTHAEDSTVRKGFLLQPSGAQADTHPDSPEKVFKFTAEGKAFKMNQVQKIQVSSQIKPTTSHPYSKDANHQPERQVSTSKMILTSLHTLISVEFGCSHSSWFSSHNSQEYINQAGLSASKKKPPVEATGCSEQAQEFPSDASLIISKNVWTTELFHTPFMPEQQIVISTVKTVVGADAALSLLPSSTLHSVGTSLPLTPDSYSVTSMLTHEAVDRKLLPTCLTLRPHPKETPLWTGAYRADHTDSESPPTLSSLGKSAVVASYKTTWLCSGCLVIQVICCNDLTLLERESTSEWS